MKLSELSARTGISKRNIHFYITEKIIVPEADPDNGYYDFSEEDARKLIFCRELRNAGLSVSDIRSILHNPLTSGHYLNLHVQKMLQEQDLLTKRIESLRYIISHLPVSPEIHDLYELSAAARIPEPSDKYLQHTWDLSMVSLVNRLLWGRFLNEKKFTDYQEFLWNKLNRMILETKNEDYQNLMLFMKKLNHSAIEQLYSNQNSRYDRIIGLSESTWQEASLEMLEMLRELLKNTSCHYVWRKYYKTYFLPTTRLSSGEYGKLMWEISPRFARYSENINGVLKITYTYLHTEDGLFLKNRLLAAFEPCLDLDNYNHGQLETLISIPMLAGVLESSDR